MPRIKCQRSGVSDQGPVIGPRSPVTCYLFAVTCALLLSVAVLAGCGKRGSSTSSSAEQDGRLVLRNMIAAYQNARSYQDSAVVRLRYRHHRRVYEDTARMQVSFQRPNRIALAAYQVELRSDGKRIVGQVADPETDNFDGQWIVRDCPPTLEIPALYQLDEIAHAVLREGMTGYPIQLDLLLAEKPLDELLSQTKQVRVLPDGAIDQWHCQRIQLETKQGKFVFWVDRDHHLLRKLEFPPETFASDIAADRLATQLTLEIEFRDASFRLPREAKPFDAELPAGAKAVTHLVPPPQPLPSELFGKTPQGFFFLDPQQRRIESGHLQGQITALMWFNQHPGCADALKQLQAACRPYLSDGRVKCFAIAADNSQVTNDQIARWLAAKRISLPWMRDLRAFGRDTFRIPWTPALVILDATGRVQIFEVGGNEQLAEQLPEVIGRLLDGQDIAQEILEKHAQTRDEYLAKIGQLQVDGQAHQPPADDTGGR